LFSNAGAKSRIDEWIDHLERDTDEDVTNGSEYGFGSEIEFMRPAM
jgi:hypothetical protein